MPPTLTQKHPPLPLEKVSALAKRFDAGEREALVPALDELVAAHPIFNVTYGAATHTYWRARVCRGNQHFSSYKDMLWPPADRAALQRMNLEGESVLYLADHVMTALTETMSNEAELVQVVCCEIKPGRSQRFAWIGELSAVFRTGASLTQNPELTSMTKQLLSACDRLERMSLVIQDHLLSQLLQQTESHALAAETSARVRAKVPIDGILYNSTKRNGSRCLVLQPTSFMDAWQIAGSGVFRNVEPLGLGHWRYHTAAWLNTTREGAFVEGGNISMWPDIPRAEIEPFSVPRS